MLKNRQELISISTFACFFVVKVDRCYNENKSTIPYEGSTKEVYMKGLKIAVIGGGSSYTPELVEGIITNYHRLPVKELVLIDIEKGLEKVRINTDLVGRMLEKAGISINLSFTLDRKFGLAGANFVMAQLRVGGLKARALDEAIPLKYNMIGQETTGIGGFFKALRTIPVMVDICRDMEEVCPHAWLINFTNPSGIVTEAILKHTSISCLGLCNVPINMHYHAAEKLKVSPGELESNFIGLNHLGFMNACRYQGEDVLPKILAIDSEDDLVKNIVRSDNADKLAASLNMMMSPYLQYFFFESEMLEEEMEAYKSDKGSRAIQVMKVEESLFKLYQDSKLNEKPKELAERGGAKYSEAAISLICSIYNDIGDNQVINVQNQGSIPDLPDDSVVEVNCIIDRKGASPVQNQALPISISGLIKSVKAYETYTIEAAVTGNRDKALLALLNNPLVHDISLGMKAFDELLVAHKEYLQGWFND